MKSEIIEKEKGNKQFVLHGKNGRDYIITCDGYDALHSRLLFCQDIKDFMLEELNNTLSDEEISQHAEFKYFVCNSGLMGWASGLQELLKKEHIKACEWTYKKISTRFNRVLQLF